MKIILVSLAACALFPAAAIAQGAPFERIPYDDLNLASPHGQSVLERRVSRAISEVCRSEEEADLDADAVARRCRHDAHREVVPEIAQAEAAAVR
jgi:UrcA family protein